MSDLKELVGYEDLKVEDVVEDMTVEIEEEITTVPCTSKKGRSYNKYIVTVSLDATGQEKRNLWLFAQEARKIVKECGFEMKNYLGAVLKLGIKEKVSKEDGQTYKEIVINEVKKRS